MPEITQSLGTHLSTLHFRSLKQYLRLVHTQHRCAQHGEWAGQTSPTARRIQEAAARGQIKHGPKLGCLPCAVLLSEHLSRDSQILLIEKSLPPFVHDAPLFSDKFRAAEPTADCRQS